MVMVLRLPHHTAPWAWPRDFWKRRMECRAESSRPTTDLTRRQSNSGPMGECDFLPGEEALPQDRKAGSKGSARLTLHSATRTHRHSRAHTFVVNLCVNKPPRSCCHPQPPDLRRPCEPSAAAWGRTVLASQAGGPKGAQGLVSQGTQPCGRTTGNQRTSSRGAKNSGHETQGR